MDIDSIRSFCLSFPHTKVKLQWGENLCFKVGEKIFAILNLDVSEKTRLAFKCTPEKFAELIELEGIRPSPYVGRYHWVALERLNCLPPGEIEGLIRESYQIVEAKAGIGKQSSKGKTKKVARRTRQRVRR